MASVIVTESISEAKITKSGLTIGSQDAYKAFDVVKQNIMKSKLFQTEVNSKVWLIIDDLLIC